jgi:hypothetical protein
VKRAKSASFLFFKKGKYCLYRVAICTTSAAEMPAARSARISPAPSRFESRAPSALRTNS